VLFWIFRTKSQKYSASDVFALQKKLGGWHACTEFFNLANTAENGTYKIFNQRSRYAKISL